MSAGKIKFGTSLALRSALDLITGDIITAFIRGINKSGEDKRLSVAIFGLPFFDFTELKTKRDYDERVKRLDDAREAMTDGIQAIDELVKDAARAKVEYAAIAVKLREVTENKEVTEK